VYSTQNCISCGKSFTITNGEKDYFARKGFELPRRCPACRKQAREQNSGKSEPLGFFREFLNNIFDK